MNKEEIEKLAGRVIMKMNLKKEVREMGESRPCTGTRVEATAHKDRVSEKDFVA